MNTKSYNIAFREDEGFVFMDWDGYFTTEEFREGSEYMLSLLEENNSTKILADVKDMVLISTEDQHWLVNNFFPRLIAAGGKTIAIVNPHYYFSKIAIEALSFKANERSLECRVFLDLKSALAWINSKE